MRSRLGPLALEGKLGDHPSQSSVWRAVHVEAKRQMAVKVFASPFGGSVDARRSLADEWAVMQKWQHPSIAKCYGGGFEEGDAYLAFEMIDGETLSSTLERRTRLPWESVMDLGDALVDALRYLHGAGVTHGRLVPDKIMAAGLGYVLVDVRADRFGSAYRTGRVPGDTETACIAPEARSGAINGSITPAADLYSLGAVLYLALTGRVPTPAAAPPSAVVMDLPVWLDRVVGGWLSDDPAARGHGIEAAAAALAEARRRSLDRTSVAAATSKGFSPLDVGNQSERDEVRKLLGRDPIAFDEPVAGNHTPFYERWYVLVAGLLAAVAVVVWMFLPLSADQMRDRAEALLESPTRSDLQLARRRYLEPLVERYPDHANATWAAGQIERVEMLQAERALRSKLKNNLPLSGEGERLYAEALKFERRGDTATALDRYRSLVTLLEDEPRYRPFVGLARGRIDALIEENGPDGGDEAATLIRRRLDEADRLYASGKVIDAKAIWLGIVELYRDNEAVGPLVEEAQSRLSR